MVDAVVRPHGHRERGTIPAFISWSHAHAHYALGLFGTKATSQLSTSKYITLIGSNRT